MATPTLRRSVHLLAWLGAGCLGPVACSSDPGSSVGVSHPTMIEVSPADFLGARACADEPGAARRYVATLFDVTEQVGGAGGEGNTEAEPDSEAGSNGGAPGIDTEALPRKCGGFQLPSSQPVSCRTSVGFGFVVSGRHYCAEIDAYDTDQLEPRGNGTRQMVQGDPNDDEPPAADAPSIPPEWDTICREATASFASIVPMRGCEPLSDQPDPAAPGEVRINTAPLLGDLACGSEPGQVERLVVTLELDGYMGARKLEVHCGEAVVYGALPAGQLLQLYVEAFQVDSTQALAGAECHALAKAGTTVTAGCSTLSQLGTLRVDLPAALAALGLACDDSISEVTVDVSGEQQRFLPPDCLQPYDRGLLASASAVTATVTATPIDGEPASILCGNIVEPGRLVVADCPAE